MNTINTIKLSLITLLSLIALSACGGSGGSNASFENTSADNTSSITSCTLAIESWTTVNSGDVVSATANSQIKFDHDSNGNKKVCKISGSASITRN